MFTHDKCEKSSFSSQSSQVSHSLERHVTCTKKTPRDSLFSKLGRPDRNGSIPSCARLERGDRLIAGERERERDRDRGIIDVSSEVCSHVTFTLDGKWKCSMSPPPTQIEQFHSACRNNYSADVSRRSEGLLNNSSPIIEEWSSQTQPTIRSRHSLGDVESTFGYGSCADGNLGVDPKNSQRQGQDVVSPCSGIRTRAPSPVLAGCSVCLLWNMIL